MAEECVGECAAMWDEVEELSQAASDKKPAPDEMEPVPISEAGLFTRLRLVTWTIPAVTWTIPPVINWCS